MNTLRTILLLLICLPAYGQSGTHLQVQLAGINGIMTTANRTVFVQSMSTPTVSGASVIVGDVFQTNTDGSGQFTLSNAVAPMLYLFTVQAPPQRTTFAVYVPTNGLGLIQASAYLVANSTATFPAGSVAWAAASSDARYIVAVAPNSAPFVVKSNGTASGLVSTNQTNVNGIVLVGGTYAGDGSGLTNQSTNGMPGLNTYLQSKAVSFTNSLTFYVDTNGNDATAIAGRSDLPWKSLVTANALAKTNNRAVIKIAPGVYDVGTNVLYCITNGAISGSGPGTVINSSCGFNTSGLLSGYYNNADFILADNGLLENLTINCATNTVYTAAYGSIHRTGGTAFTNPIVRNVYATNFTTDGFYVEQTQRCNVHVEGGSLRGHWDVIAPAIATSDSVFGFHNVLLFTDAAGGSSLNTTRQATIVSANQGIVELYDCYGISTNGLNAYGLRSQQTDHALRVFGGNFHVYATNGGTIVNQTGPKAVDGWFQLNDINYNGGGGSAYKQGFNADPDGTIPMLGTAINEYGEFFINLGDVRQGSGTLPLAGWSFTINTNTFTGTTTNGGNLVVTGLTTNQGDVYLTSGSFHGSGANNTASNQVFAAANLLTGTLGDARYAPLVSPVANGTGNIVSGTADGTSPTLFITNALNTGSFQIVLLEGTTPNSGGGVAVVTYTAPYSYTPNVFITPFETNSVGIVFTAKPSVTAISASSFTFTCTGASALTAGNIYKWNVLVR